MELEPKYKFSFDLSPINKNKVHTLITRYASFLVNLQQSVAINVRPKKTHAEKLKKSINP